MLEVLAALIKLEVINIERRAIVVFFIEIIVILVPGIRGQGREPQVIVDKQTQGQNISVVLFPKTNVGVELLVATA